MSDFDSAVQLEENALTWFENMTGEEAYHLTDILAGIDTEIFEGRKPKYTTEQRELLNWCSQVIDDADSDDDETMEQVGGDALDYFGELDSDSAVEVLRILDGIDHEEIVSKTPVYSAEARQLISEAKDIIKKNT